MVHSVLSLLVANAPHRFAKGYAGSVLFGLLLRHWLAKNAANGYSFDALWDIGAACIAVLAP